MGKLLFVSMYAIALGDGISWHAIATARNFLRSHMKRMDIDCWRFFEMIDIIALIILISIFIMCTYLLILQLQSVCI